MITVDYKAIDELKSEITNLVKDGKFIGISQFRISGKVIGAGFKPYWTSRYDSKIDKLELNILNKSGAIIPFVFNNIVGYEKSLEDLVSENDSSKKYLEIHVFSPNKAREKEPYDKIRLEIEI
jgi:hypothetical protein